MNVQDYQVVIGLLSEEDGGGTVATLRELPGCMSEGETRAKALTNREHAIATWIYCAPKDGADDPGTPVARSAA